MKRAAVAVSLLLAVAGLPVVASPAAAATPTAGQATYTPLEPVRLLDTREGIGALRGPVGPGGTVDLRVADGVRVPLDATAVVLNVTATGASASTDIRVYPTPVVEEPPPTVSNLNVVAGSTVANLVHVKVGRNGTVRLRNESGRVHLLADLSGYFREGSGGATYVPVGPRRLLDTRDDARPLAAGEVRRLTVTGTNAAPADASAVALNVTAVGATRTTDVRVWPTRTGEPPTVSNLNPPPGRPVAAAVVVGVGTGGSISLRSSAGTVHLAVDLVGWYVPSESGSTFHALEPVRLVDTREPQGDPLAPTAPSSPPRRIGPGGTYDLRVAGQGNVPSQATAVVLNVTGVAPTATSDVRVYPSAGGAVPEASNLNVVSGQTSANAVVARVGRDGRVTLRNSSGELFLVVDLVGWFGPTGDGWDVSWPQCLTAGSSDTKPLPQEGAFAVVGLTRGRPFTANECFAKEWAWASSLPGEPSVYLNVDAPGSDSPHWTDAGPMSCSGASSDSGCAYNYGWSLAGYALERMPPTPSGGTPFVWFDIENGPVWQTGTTNSNAVAVNRGVVNGAVARVRGAGYRQGLYAERTSAGRDNDFVQIMGQWRLPHLPVWVYAAPQSDPTPQCAPSESITGGPIHMVQIQPAVSGKEFDVNHLC